MDDRLPAVSPDGKLNWPAFFKSVGTEAKFQSLFAQGICTGTRKVTTTMLQENKVVVNSLPEVSFTALAVKVQPGIVMAVNAQGESCALVTHPAQVSRINVSGTMPPAGIAPGMIIRLQGKVDASGKGTEPVDALEIVDGNPDVTAIAVTPEKLQTIVGMVTRAKRNIFQLKMSSGKVRRLTFELAEKPIIAVDAKSLSAVLPGSEVKVKGHVYEGEGSLAKKTIFASDLEVTEKFVWDQPGKPNDDKVAADQPVAGEQKP
jgi:hypothetical protein